MGLREVLASIEEGGDAPGNYEEELIDAAHRLLILEKAAGRVRKVIRNESPSPYFHRRIMGRHRREWPVLWKALDGLVEAIEPGDQDEHGHSSEGLGEL